MTATPHKLGNISFGGDQTTRMRRTTVIEWSDDDEVPVFPPPNMREPPRSTRTCDLSRVGEEIPEPETREIPEQQVRETPTQKSTGVPTERATEVPEQQTEANPEQQAETAPKQ